ncbi:uncharacterized protein J3D65DRAFT_675124 [Phyllosticta citribraziliensis]|uniref:CS domain-containing protein n=1 Tax=Phyllosticta citribraziliensis TaxID=989973 RepID=A0ABR1M0F0_9PEZI
MIPTSKHRILWAQNSSTTYVDRNFCLLTLVPSTRFATHKVKVQLAEDGLKLRAKGLHIDLQLFDAIHTAQYKRRDKDNSLEVLVFKREMSDKDWPRLLKPNPDSSFDYCEGTTIMPYRSIVMDEGEDLRDRLCKLRTVFSDSIDEHSATGEAKLLSSFWQRPMNFNSWFSRVNRAVQLRNFEESVLLRLPRELRDEIWKFALVDVEPARMFDRLLPYAEDQFARGIPNLGNQFLVRNQFHLAPSERSRVYTRNKRGRQVVNFFTKPPRYDRGVGLFTTSRAVSRESLKVLYHKTHFIFPDQYGIVGLQCFLNTIGKHNMSNLRKVTIHMPSWHFSKNSDKQRAGWVYQSAKAHGLQVAKNSRDPLLRSLNTALTDLLAVKRLRELDIQVSPFVTRSLVLPMRLPAYHDSMGWSNTIYRRTMPKYLARSDAERAFLRKLKDVTHRIRVRFVALEYTTTEADFRNDQDKEKYWNIVKERCTQWGFDYVRVQSRGEEPFEQLEEGEVDE